MRLRDCPDYLQFEQQAVPVCEHRHGQGSSQVHRVQRTPRVPHQQEYYRGESHLSVMDSQDERERGKDRSIDVVADFLLTSLSLSKVSDEKRNIYPTFVDIYVCNICQGQDSCVEYTGCFEEAHYELQMIAEQKELSVQH